MPQGRPLSPLVLDEEQRGQLMALSRSTSMPHGLVQRARLILASAEASPTRRWRNASASRPTSWGSGDAASGRQGSPASTTNSARDGRAPTATRKWRRSSTMPSRKRTMPPIGAYAPWRTRRESPRARCSAGSPCSASSRTRTFKLSTDPFFIEKVRDCGALPPSTGQRHGPLRGRKVPAGLEPHPASLAGPGLCEGYTHDYLRHGTTTLFAALDAATVIARCRQRTAIRSSSTSCVSFTAKLRDDLDLHLVVDNYATHKHPKVRAWLARRPRFHLALHPDLCLLAQPGGAWFGLISQQAIKRGSFQSVTQLKQTIMAFTDQYNHNSTPFVWVATAQSILEKLERLATAYFRDSTLAAPPFATDSGYGMSPAGGRMLLGFPIRLSEEIL